MTLYQRRVFSICIFAFCFILFYEARGMRLIGVDAQAIPAGNEGLRDHFVQQAGLGVIVFVLGALLLFGLRRAEQKIEFTRAELALYALGMGILIGTAAVSWLRASQNFS